MHAYISVHNLSDLSLASWAPHTPRPKQFPSRPPSTHRGHTIPHALTKHPTPQACSLT